jgi:hypothetical protein
MDPQVKAAGVAQSKWITGFVIRDGSTISPSA